MEERQDSTKNVKMLLQMVKDDKLKDLHDKVKAAQTKASSIVKKLNEKENELKRKAQAQAQSELFSETEDNAVGASELEKNSEGQVFASEKTEKNNIQNEVSAAAEKTSVDEAKPAKKTKTVKTKKAEEQVEPAAAEVVVDKNDDKKAVVADKTQPQALENAEKSEKTVEVPAQKSAKTSKTAKAKAETKVEQPENAVEVKTEKAPADKKDVAKAENVEKENAKAQGGKKAEQMPAAKVEEKPQATTAASDLTNKKEEEKEEAKPQRKSILSFIVRKADAEPQPRETNKTRNNARAERPYGDRNNGSRPPRPTNGANRPNFSDRQNSQFGAKVGGIKAPRAQEIAFVPPKDTKNTRKKTEKSYEEKRISNNKKTHIKELTVADFDENKTGYRKVRKPKQKKEEQSNFIKIEKAVITKEFTPIKELSEKFGISAVEITKRLFKEGITKTINDSIDFDTAEFIASDLGIEVSLKMEKSAEELMNEGFAEDTDDAALLVKRPPIVTVMGHVDHGKTSLLDKIRSANVAEGEAGGITQHIGAYSVEIKNNKITFIDTPGHAAFTAMRARGAQVTDIAIIVVAADDGIKPQTVEAINHAKAAGVSIIVAANKIDKPHVDLDRVRQQLSEYELLVEEWGGDIIMVPVSAKTGEGIEKLLESVLLVAEMGELKANPARKARGTVIEAKLDKGKGPLATVLVQNGTLHVGDNIVAGTVVGRVRAMINEKGNMVKEAGPSTAVAVLGLEDVPNAGDAIFAVDEEKLSKLVAQERKNKEREEMLRSQQKVTLDDLFSKISEGELKNLNLIIKADVQGSAEAVKQSLQELSNDEVKVSILHAAVGAINETDVTLAESSNAIIIGFNVRPDSKAKVQAERSHVEVKLYRIIYDAIDDIKKAMKGMLAPKFEDVYTGKAEVRETFKITGVGMVAGCYVTDGKIVRQAKLRIYRNDVMICEGNVLQLKRFKDEVKEVNQGYECGISIEGFNDIKVGDFIESYIVEQSDK